MFGRSRGLDVGWWLSFDDCDLHHPLYCAGPCEVLICGQFSVVSRQLLEHATGCCQLTTDHRQLTMPLFYPKNLPTFGWFSCTLTP
jgi:hypothetical protein